MQRNSSTLDQGQHACFLYDDVAKAIDTAAPFVAAGLRAGERCAYVVGEHDVTHVRAALALHGIDVKRWESDGALQFFTQWEVAFPDGSFDPATMIAWVRAAIDESVGAGYEGLRIAAEMTWALQLGVDHNRLIHYEAMGDSLYPDLPLVALCMYDRRRFPGAVCTDALRVHPYVVLEDGPQDNVFFEPPAAVLQGVTWDERLDWMLEKLRSLRGAEAHRRELEQSRTARERAEASARGRDELLSLLAHELRTPLTSTLVTVQGALRRLENAEALDRAQLERTLRTIERQARKQGRLVEQVLTAAGAAKGALAFETERLDLASLVRGVVEQAEAVNPLRRLELDTPDTLWLDGDPLRLEQLLTNLLDNALKFSPEDATVEVRLVRGTTGEVVCSVRDRGRGVPAGEQERIFERYHRVETGSPGLGLGLFLCQEIVGQHRGEIHVESPADGGARFVIRLPA